MLRIATLNTWKCDGDYRKRIDLTARQLKEENIDILCCQEVFHSLDGRYETAGKLADSLDMSYIFSSARQKQRRLDGKWMESASGLAILTGPEVWLHTGGSFPLPSNKWDGGRIAQYAVLRRNGKKILVMNVHLSHLESAGLLRIEQLETVLAHPLMKKEFAAVFLCGDFNAEPDSCEIKFLTSRLDCKITDCYPAGDGAPSNSTLVKPADESGMKTGARIDYIFSISTSDSTRVKLRNSRITLRPDEQGVMPSDHFCVITEARLHVKKRTAQTYRHPNYRQSRPYFRHYPSSPIPGL